MKLTKIQRFELMEREVKDLLHQNTSPVDPTYRITDVWFLIQLVKELRTDLSREKSLRTEDRKPGLRTH